MIKRLKDSKAFTLIELVVVVGIIGILVLIASSNFSGQTKNAQHKAALADAKVVSDATEMYNIDNEDWPRLTDVPYTSEQLEEYSENFYDNTGEKVTLDPEGNYYDIDYDKLNTYAKAPTHKENYILQNPVGKVFYMDNLSEEGKLRVDYSQPSQPEEDVGVPPSEPVDFAYTGDVQEFVVPVTGKYKLEVWGAQGGYTDIVDNKGGYSNGSLHLKKGISLKIFSGGMGDKTTSRENKVVAGTGGWNGGGDAYSYNGSGGGTSGGGGGTDIRVDGSTLYHRVIVAGGGGGAHYNFDRKRSYGGFGGGEKGGYGGANAGRYENEGGGQKGIGYKVAYGSRYSPSIPASFGYGATAGASYGAGGGGGWYGGNASGHSGAGGGSGYVHTPDSYKPAGWKLTEEHYLTDTEMIAGNQSMPNPKGGTMIGNTGHGFVRITYVGE